MAESHLWLACENLYMDNWAVGGRLHLGAEISSQLCDCVVFLFMHWTKHVDSNTGTGAVDKLNTDKIHEFLWGWLKMEMQQSLCEHLIDRCSSGASASQEWVLSGQESLVAWLDDDRWCQWEKLTSWIKHKEMWRWKIAWLRSFIWSNGFGLVSSSPSWVGRGGGPARVATWLSFLTSSETAERRCGMQTAENNWSCLINLKASASTGCSTAAQAHFSRFFFFFFQDSKFQAFKLLSCSYFPQDGEINTLLAELFVILTQLKPTYSVTVKSSSDTTIFLEAIGEQPSVRVVNAIEASLNKYIQVRAILFKKIQSTVHWQSNNIHSGSMKSLKKKKKQWSGFCPCSSGCSLRN